MLGRQSTAVALTVVQGRRGLVLAVFLALVGALLVVAPPQPAAAACSGNAVVCENELPGTPESEWDIDGVGDPSIQGFATEISVDAGKKIDFKIDTDASAYSIKIYRLGWYQGNGARLVDTISPSASLPQNQPACATDDSTDIYDCGTWHVSASWNVPSGAVSGVYIARLIRSDNGGDSHIPFIVRNDGNTSDVLFQTSDTTWQAYNTYGGASFYVGQNMGRAYKLSYNRPFSTRAWQGGRDFLFANEYPMIRFLERNGYDVSYVSGLDTHRDASLITKHKAFLSVGHDEYWSADQRTHVTAARDAGTNLAFFAGNDVYWKTRWEPSQDGSNTADRTLVCYKDTWANTPIDPVEATATWRDPRFGDNGFGPENSLIGTQYQANFTDLAIKVDSDEGKLRLWRNTTLASLGSGSSASLAPHTIGYESNEDVDNGHRPAGLIRLSTTTGPTPEYLTDYGNTVVAANTTHHLTMYKAASGALVFSAGSVQWAWGLDANHDGVANEPADPRMQQATVNLLADMGVSATTLMSALHSASKSTDTTPPTATITSPAAGESIQQGSLVTVTGTASDTGGRVAGVEVSVDGGATWHPADGRQNFSYTGILTGNGPGAVQARATDDSGLTQTDPTKVAVDSPCPCSLFGAATPTQPDSGDASAVTLGVRFTAADDGFVSGVRFYKSAANTGTHIGRLYSADGQLLAEGTFTDETQTGWQTLHFSQAVEIQADQTYVAAYVAPNGHYAVAQEYFTAGGHTSGALTAPGGPDNPNGVFANGSAFPNQSWKQTNYYVDPIYSSTDTTPLAVRAVTPASGANSVLVTAPITAKFNRKIDASSGTFQVVDGDNQPVDGTTSYDADTKTLTFEPTQSLAPATSYSAYVNGSIDGEGLPAPYSWTFTTAAAPAPEGVCPCTLFPETTQPTNGPAADTDSVQLGVAFTSSATGVISGVRFYRDAANAGPHTVKLWTAAGAELAAAEVVDEGTSGWQEASFDSPIAIDANTTYVASYSAPAGRYSYDGGGLSAKVTYGPLSTVPNGGRYTYGNGAPTSVSSTNYFVTPVYNSPPNQAPGVVSIKPGDKASSVPVDSSVVVAFDQVLQPGSAKITVTPHGGDAVAGTMNSESVSQSAVFTPSEPLAPGTKFDVKVTGALSPSGTPMDGPYTAEFTTAGAAACPCSLMETSTTPTLSDSGDADSVTLGLRFTASVDGYVKGVRYYRDAANTGTHVGKLWSSDGTELASATFDDGEPGWQSVTFNRAVAVDAGTTYVASYTAPNGHYSVATGYFEDAVSNSPLAAEPGAGVYSYTKAFPNQSYGNSNYYVDVIFTTEDADPPVVSATKPSGEDPAPLDTTITAKFERDIDPDTLTVSVTDAQDQAVSGTVSYAEASRTATFTPAVALDPEKTYAVSVSASSSSGVAMAEPVTWSFTTDSAPLEGTTTTLFDGADPATPAWNDSDAITVGVTFSSSVPATITAIRFYSGAGNTGTRTVTLWSAAKEPLATGSYSGTATGWRTVKLDQPVEIAAGDSYVASYYAPSGHYAVSPNVFGDPYTVDPLTVPANGGAYVYGDAFPGSASAASYGVDVVAVY